LLIFDPFILEPRVCNSQAIQFLVAWRNGNLPKTEFSKTDRRVLAGYKFVPKPVNTHFYFRIIYDDAGNIKHFYITCGLQAYQFRAYLYKRVFWVRQAIVPRFLPKGTDNQTTESSFIGQPERAPLIRAKPLNNAKE
jgi:hypothetical protein